MSLRQNAHTMNSKSNSRLVYATDVGRTCPACRQALAQCVCQRVSARPAGDGVVRVSRSAKGRGGKTVTLVEGVPLDDAALAQLGKQLKAACGSGGTVKDGVIEVQGDHRELLTMQLVAKGYVVKQKGG